jgi:type VI secretion system protein ImpH
METDLGTQDPSMSDLTQMSGDINFFQLMRRLEAEGYACFGEPELRLSGHASLAFQPTFVEKVTFSVSKDEAHQVVSVEANDYHLTGNRSLLPEHFSESIIREALDGNGGPKAFLDLFNRGILASLYGVKKRFDPLLFNGTHRDQEFFKLFDAMVGLPKSSELYALIPERFSQFWRSNPGAFSNRRLNYSYLKSNLQLLLNTKIEVALSDGRWLPVEEEYQLRLDGEVVLDGEKSLGTQYWCNDAEVVITIAAPTPAFAEALLPSGRDYSDLVKLLAFLVDGRFGVVINMQIQDSEIPSLMLGHGAKLGYSSWLKPEDSARPVTEFPDIALTTDDLQWALTGVAA